MDNSQSRLQYKRNNKQQILKTIKAQNAILTMINNQRDPDIKYSFQNNLQFQILSTILNKQEDKRRQTDIDRLKYAIKSTDFYFFYQKELQNNDIFNIITRNMKLKIVDPFDTIAAEGSVGNTIYIMIRGQALALVKQSPNIQLTNNTEQLLADQSHLSQNDQTTQQTIIYQQTQSQSMQNFFTQSTRQKTVTLQQSKEELILIQHPGKQISRQVKELQYFGDKSVRYKKKRSSSIVALTQCYLITLSADIYNKYLGEGLEIQKVVEQLKQVPLLHNFDEYAIEVLYRNSKRIEYKIGEQIYKKGEHPIDLFFIEKGEVELQKSIQIKQQLNSAQQLIQTLNKFEKVNKLQANITNPSLQIRMAQLTQNQFFGEEEIIYSLSERKYTAICHSATCSLLAIKGVFFLEFYKKYNLGQSDIESSFCRYKSHWRQKLLQKNMDFYEKITQQKEMFKSTQQLSKKQELISLINEMKVNKSCSILNKNRVNYSQSTYNNNDQDQHNISGLQKTFTSDRKIDLINISNSQSPQKGANPNKTDNQQVNDSSNNQININKNQGFSQTMNFFSPNKTNFSLTPKEEQKKKQQKFLIFNNKWNKKLQNIIKKMEEMTNGNNNSQSHQRHQNLTIRTDLYDKNAQQRLIIQKILKLDKIMPMTEKGKETLQFIQQINKDSLNEIEKQRSLSIINRRKKVLPRMIADRMCNEDPNILLKGKCKNDSSYQIIQNAYANLIINEQNKINHDVKSPQSSEKRLLVQKLSPNDTFSNKNQNNYSSYNFKTTKNKFLQI